MNASFKRRYENLYARVSKAGEENPCGCQVAFPLCEKCPSDVWRCLARLRDAVSEALSFEDVKNSTIDKIAQSAIDVNE